jgi:hypothetical protein
LLRGKQRLPAIVQTVCETQSNTWSKVTRDTARADAQRVLESLIAELGVENAVQAMHNQGFDGQAYRYLLKPLYEEARRRRQLSVDGVKPIKPM